MRSIRTVFREIVVQNFITALAFTAVLQLAFCFIVLGTFISLSTKFLSENINLLLERSETAGYQVLLNNQLSSLVQSLNNSSPIQTEVLISANDRLIFESSAESLDSPLDFRKTFSKPTMNGKYDVVVKIHPTQFILMNLILFGIFFFGSWIFFQHRHKKFARTIDQTIAEVVLLIESIKIHSANLDSPASRFTARSSTLEVASLESSLQMLLEKIDEQKGRINQLSYAEALGTISRQVAHDIRSPLSALQILASLNHQMSQDHHSLLTGATKRITEIANNMLQHAKKPQVAPEKLIEINLKRTVLQLIKEKQFEHNKKKVQISFRNEADTRATQVALPAGQIERIISNLVNNSVEAGASRIVVSMKSCGGIQTLTVFDNGEGISNLDLVRRCQSGVSLKTGAASNSHSGLGLSHAKSVISAAGGKLRIRSKTKNGTAIWMRLPGISGREISKTPARSRPSSLASD